MKYLSSNLSLMSTFHDIGLIFQCIYTNSSYIVHFTCAIVSPCTLQAELCSVGVDHCFPSVNAGTTENFSSSEYYPGCNCLGCPDVEVHWNSLWTAW